MEYGHGSKSTRPGKHTKSELENGPVEIVDEPIDSMVMFQFVFCMFTRGYVYIYIYISSFWVDEPAARQVILV